MNNTKNSPRNTNDSLIATARLSKGWTQAQLADAIGVKQSQIANWETGYRKPKLESLVKIAGVLGVEYTDLI